MTSFITFKIKFKFFKIMSNGFYDKYKQLFDPQSVISISKHPLFSNFDQEIVFYIFSVRKFSLVQPQNKLIRVIRCKEEYLGDWRRTFPCINNKLEDLYQWQTLSRKLITLDSSRQSRPKKFKDIQRRNFSQGSWNIRCPKSVLSHLFARRKNN